MSIYKQFLIGGLLLLSIPSFVYGISEMEFAYPLPQMQLMLKQEDKTKDNAYHIGIDAGFEYGAEMPVTAIADGVVKYAHTVTGFGYLVMIEHTLPDGEKIVSQYGHLSSRFKEVKVGENVRVGQTIGKLGKKSENGDWIPHIHFALFDGAFSLKGGWKYYGHVRKLKALQTAIEPYGFFEQYIPQEENKKAPHVISIQPTKKRGHLQLLNRAGSTHPLVLKLPTVFIDKIVDVAVGDITGHDGKPEIVLARMEDDVLLIEVWNRNGTQAVAFEPFLYEERMPEEIDIVVGDVIGSKKNEIIIGSGNPSQISIFRSNGEEITTIQPFYKKRKTSIDIAVAEIDPTKKSTKGGSTSGGKQEIVALAQHGKPTVAILRGKGKRLQAFQPFSRLRYNGSVAAGDVTGDGIAEIIIGTRYNKSTAVRVFDAQGQEMEDNRYFPLSQQFRGRIDVDTVEYNEDSIADIITSVRKGGRARITTHDGVTQKVLFDTFLYQPKYTKGLLIAGWK